MAINPENTGTNVQEPTKAKSRVPIALIILVPIIIFFISVGIFFITKLQSPVSQNQQPKTFIESFKKETSSLEFPSIRWKESLFKYYDNALAQKDKPKQFKELSGAFDFLLRIYILNPNPNTRKSLEELKAFLGKNYKELYQEKKFSYTCMDTECNLSLPPSEIADIIKRVENLNSIDPLVKKLTLQSLIRVGAYTGSEKWPQYDSAFLLLKNEYKKNNKSTELKNILQKLADYIQSNFPQESKSVQKIKGEDNHYKID